MKSSTTLTAPLETTTTSAVSKMEALSLKLVQIKTTTASPSWSLRTTTTEKWLIPSIEPARQGHTTRRIAIQASPTSFRRRNAAIFVIREKMEKLAILDSKGLRTSLRKKIYVMEAKNRLAGKALKYCSGSEFFIISQFLKIDIRFFINKSNVPWTIQYYTNYLLFQKSFGL